MGESGANASITRAYGIVPGSSTNSDAVDLPAASSGGVRISWASLDGGMVNIRNIPTDALGRCQCLVCRHAVVARRGGKRKWHFAHVPGAPPCPLHSEEVLKRFEAKMHIHSVLQGLERLAVLVTCRSRCGIQAEQTAFAHDWVEGWDSAQVNFEANGAEPDLLLVAGDQPLAAIEVRGTTPVGTSKETRLERLQIPWAEILVDEALNWDPAVPLKVYRLEPEGWLCPLCSARNQATRNRSPQCEVHESRLDELREQGLLRTLWLKRFHASHLGREWDQDLEICDLVDARGLPLHRLMVDVAYGYVIAGVTVHELVSAVEPCRDRFRVGLKDWKTSLDGVGVKVSEVDSGWGTVGEAKHLYDSEETRRRLSAILEELADDPAVTAACLVLGVARDHTFEDLKTARRDLARSWHPDLANQIETATFHAKMVEINAAFDLLSGLRQDAI